MTTTTIREHAHAVADIIRQQIGTGVFMSLGARNLGSFTDATTGNPGLAFQATILPFNKTGARADRGRTMRVRVTLTPADLYDVRVDYSHRGETKTHHEATDIDAFALRSHLLALDYDGPETLNPRLA